METEIKKKPVTAGLRSLAVGESVTFPVEQRSTVRSTASKLMKDFIRTGWAVKITDDFDNFEVRATRTN